jgi:hypothetical protein
MAFEVSASTRAIIWRRITSSLARFSAMRPSASAMDLVRSSSRSFSDFCQGLPLVHSSAQLKHLLWDMLGRFSGSVTKDV